jgi:hypothetical protein
MNSGGADCAVGAAGKKNWEPTRNLTPTSQYLRCQISGGQLFKTGVTQVRGLLRS